MRFLKVDEYPERIDKARLVGFGGPKSIIVWWTPERGGYVHAIATTDGKDNADEIIDAVSGRPFLTDLDGFLEDLTDFSISDPVPEHPGYEALANYRDGFAAGLGWLQREAQPHPTEFLHPKAGA